MRKSLLIKLHIYSGLFTSFYLIAFGLSSIILNHKIKVEKSEVTYNWDSKVQVDVNLSDRDLAENIRDQMGFMGWTPPWENKRDSASFQFMITHTGRNYYLNLNLETGDLAIAEAPKGFIAVLHGLHFFNGKIPNAPFFIRTWAVYQWLALFVMFISLILGLWLWIKYSYKTWEGIVFGGLFVASIIIMILV